MKSVITMSRRRAERTLTQLKKDDATMAEVKPFLDHGNYHVRNRARHILDQPAERSVAQKERKEAAKPE